MLFRSRAFKAGGKYLQLLCRGRRGVRFGVPEQELAIAQGKNRGQRYYVLRQQDSLLVKRIRSS